MNGEIKRDRSPSCPKMTLSDAIELARKLYSKIGKSSLKPEVAASALGYSGLNGAALGTLATLGYYGLIEKQRNGPMSMSQLAIKLIHPVNTAQEQQARKEAALAPKVFADLFGGGYHHCDESVLSNHLVQTGFTSDGAKRAASVYKANIDFARLDQDIVVDATAEMQPQSAVDNPEALTHLETPTYEVRPLVAALPAVAQPVVGGSELPVPLDNGQIARIPFPMSEDTYDMFIDTLRLWKRKLVKSEKPVTTAFAVGPAVQQNDESPVAALSHTPELRIGE